MILFILTIFCNLLSSGYLQETNNLDDFNLIQHNGKRSESEWPLQTFHTIQGNFYGQAQRNIIPKPCSRRSNSEGDPIEHQLSPPLASKVETLPDIAASLKPQALKNGENDLKTNDNQPTLSSPQSPIAADNLYATRNALTVSNPVIDSLEDTHHEILPTNIKEVKDDNLKPSDPLQLAPSNDYHPASTSEVYSANSRSYQPPSPSVFRFVPSNEYSNEPENQYISIPSNVVPTVHNEFRSTNINTPHAQVVSEFFPELADHHNPTQVHSVSSGLKPYSERSKSTTEIPNKCLHDDHPNNLAGHSRRSMSSFDDDDDKAKDILSNDREIQNNNDPYIESHIDNEDAMASVLNVEKNTLKSSKDQGVRSSDKTKLPVHEKSVSRVGRPQFNEARREMIEPAKGPTMTNMGQSSLMLMQTERICYACSTANNPSCWAPDRRTTVKYCRKGNNACITKTFGKGSTFTLIRDCGKSCDDSDMGGLMPKYKSCSMCHSELCNGAYSINGHNIIFALILIALVKYLN